MKNAECTERDLTMLPPLVTRILLQLSVGGRALKGRARKSRQQAAAWSGEPGPVE